MSEFLPLHQMTPSTRRLNLTQGECMDTMTPLTWKERVVGREECHPQSLWLDTLRLVIKQWLSGRRLANPSTTQGLI